MPKSPPGPRVRSIETVYRTAWFQIESRACDGFAQPYYVMRTADYVTVLPIVEGRHVLFVKQYRPALDDYSLELPSGHIDPGETPEQAARRELIEETGAEAMELRALSPLRSDTGRMNNELWTFVASARQVATPEPGIELQSIPLTALPGMIASGELRHAIDLAVITQALAVGALKLDW